MASVGSGEPTTRHRLEAREPGATRCSVFVAIGPQRREASNSLAQPESSALARTTACRVPGLGLPGLGLPSPALTARQQPLPGC
jgi:hypothetical protein